MKKLGFLFYVIIVCSSFTGYNLYHGIKTFHTASFFPPQGSPYNSISIDCANENCLSAGIPTKPRCSGGNCIPYYIYKKGDIYILVYKVVGKGESISVPLEGTKVSDRFINKLNTSKDKKIFVNVDVARSKGNVMQLRAQ